MGARRHGARRGGRDGLRALRERHAQDAEQQEAARQYRRPPRPNGWACPRPDKRHHRTADAAERHLAEVRAEAGAGASTARVYECQCGAGFVWGRR